MSTYKIYQIDAFTDRVFGGNPAAVVPLENWLPDATLQNIALENNLSETAYFVKDGEGYHLRWFTPTLEIELCGHATLASAYVLFEELNYNKDEIRFSTMSGDLFVKKDGDLLVMDFPATEMQQVDYSKNMEAALGQPYLELHESETKFMAVVEDQAAVLACSPNMQLLAAEKKNTIVTSKGENFDFVSRFFAPASGVDEDPVTGSAHTALAPYWAKQLNKTTLTAKQISKRGGELECIVNGDRVIMKGQARRYLIGDIFI